MAAPIVEDFEMTAALKDLTDWLIQQGLEDTPVEVWLEACCNRLVAAGVPLQRVNLSLQAHHPQIGAVAFRWHRGGTNEKFDYQRSGVAIDDYKKSPLFHLVSNEIIELRQNLTDPDPELNFPIFEELRAQGTTEYYATKRYFLRQDHATPPDNLEKPQEGMLLSLTTEAEGGFTEAHLNCIRTLLPSLCLNLKCGANRAMAEDITATYLGRDASKRVLSGDIMRGSSETISAVIWYFDLQGFTKLSEVLPGPEIIEMLNDCFGVAVDIVESHGGNVLKFMGDGMLAIFDLNDIPDAPAVAVQAAVELREAFVVLNAQRKADDLTATGFTLALHAGDVLYGNIGGKTRLDFTVIGTAVNTTARILGMCSHVDQNIVISSKVAEPLRSTRSDLVSLGQYRLRGVTDRQELFTLD